MSAVATPCPAAGVHCVHWNEGHACCFCAVDPPEPSPARSAATTDPIAIVCPRCLASASARCLEPKPGPMGGEQFVGYFHRERIALAARVL